MRKPGGLKNHFILRLPNFESRVLAGCLPNNLRSAYASAIASRTWEETLDMWSACCARAASGQVAAAPPSSVMNSRRVR
jgi:hypothetical protein